MKIDLVRTIVAICIGALLGWGFYAMAQDSMNGQPLGFAIGIETALLGIGLVGIEYEEYPRSGTMIRATWDLGAISIKCHLCIYWSQYLFLYIKWHHISHFTINCKWYL